ncbi:MAG: zinc ABC transporter substrate-binding protein [Clostridia bacterium]|nr:zinc ABC transporter substrate-binding protein [Clostridia bacterium]
MKTFKRAAALLLTLLLLLGTAACATTATGSDKIKVVTTIFPIYDWVREVAGDDDCVEVTLLLDNGVDLHSYSPTADDIVKIASCDLFLYVGGESDKWVDDALKEATNKDMKVIGLMDTLGDALREEELKEGMQAEEEEEEEEGPEYDEHVWLSLKNAAVLCERIGAALGEVDREHASDYAANAAAYINKVKTLDGQYADAVAAARCKTLLFADRFPFRYLVEDYGLDYFAAFIGCSAESEASFETMIFLAKKVDELGLRAILQTESADGSIARTVRENTAAKDQTVLTLDSLQSVTKEKVAQGVTYLSVMEKNLDVLKDALK